MGSYTKALGPESQKIVTQLSPKILDACSKAQDELAAGRGLTEKTRWFGTTPAATVKTNVGKLRAFFNLNAITLRFAGGPDKKKARHRCCFNAFPGVERLYERHEDP